MFKFTNTPNSNGIKLNWSVLLNIFLILFIVGNLVVAYIFPLEYISVTPIGKEWLNNNKKVTKRVKELETLLPQLQDSIAASKIKLDSLKNDSILIVYKYKPNPTYNEESINYNIGDTSLAYRILSERENLRTQLSDYIQ